MQKPPIIDPYGFGAVFPAETLMLANCSFGTMGLLFYALVPKEQEVPKVLTLVPKEQEVPKVLTLVPKEQEEQEVELENQKQGFLTYTPRKII